MINYYSMPANFNEKTIDEYVKLNRMYPNGKVIETYGQLTSIDMLNSGRVSDVLPEVDIRSLEKYVNYSKDCGIDFHYTLNPSCIGNIEFSMEGMKKLIKALTLFKSIGIDSLTITSPQMMELVIASGMDFKIKASAICEINSPRKALFYQKLGAERIVIDPDITRNFQKIKNIVVAFGDRVEIIVNNVCYKDCAYKMFHYNHDSHCTKHNGSQCIKNYFTNRCSIQKAENLKNPIQLNWIRPEDLKLYQKCGIHHFKIQGRQNVLRGKPIEVLRSYITENFEGNLFDLITLFAPYNAFQPMIENKKLDGFLQKFYDNPDFCNDLCDKCQYCENYALKSIVAEDAKIINNNALKFYKSCDDYQELIKDCLQQVNEDCGIDGDDEDFDFQV